MSPSDIAAWWGAVVATLVFLWELYKNWQAGPRLRLTVNANMIFIGDASPMGQSFVTLRAVNIGDAPTSSSPAPVRHNHFPSGSNRGRAGTD
jgi:hypothetical protein